MYISTEARQLVKNWKGAQWQYFVKYSSEEEGYTKTRLLVIFTQKTGQSVTKKLTETKRNCSSQFPPPQV